MISTLENACSRRGASMGRSDSGEIAGQLESLRDDLKLTESTLRSFAEGFEPGWYDRNKETGELEFTPNFPTPESRAEWVAGLEEKAAGYRARIAKLEASPADAQRFHLQRVRLDSGGYDEGGAYWGHGAPLFRFESEDGLLSGFLRVDREDRTATAERLGVLGDPIAGARYDLDRETAKAEILADYPAARFFR